MELLLWGMDALLCGLLAVLLIKLRLMQKSADEIKEAFGSRLLSGSNTLIDISSGDRALRHLAGTINKALRKLRAERQRFQQGDTELKNAVTNISHDLRTPLTAICGYLDLLEEEEKSDPHPAEWKARPSDVARLLEAAQRAQRAKFEIAAVKYFGRQKAAIAQSLNGQEKADWSVWDTLQPYISENHVESMDAWAALGEAGQKALIAGFVGSLIDWPGEESTLESIFKPLWKQTYDAGTAAAKKVYAIRGVDRPELVSPARLISSSP